MKHELQGLLVTAFLIGFFVDVFFFPAMLNNGLGYGSDLRLLFLSMLWLLVGKIAHFNSITTFKVVLLFLGLLAILFVFFPTHPAVERVASWVYVYLAIGIVQQLFESRNERENVQAA
jgi:hypothetical protein